MGGPVRFISAKGPMPISKAAHATASICAVVPTPSSKSKQASLSQGTKNLLTTKPGRSLQTMTTFPSILQYCSTRAMVSSLDNSEGMTSTNRFFAGW